MSALRRLAPAKLNLTLDVIGRRPDGYHEIRSVVTTVSLADELSVEPGCAFVMSADEGFDTSGLPAASNQLSSVEIAVALLVSERARMRGEAAPALDAALKTGIADVAIRLHKRIPASAGLGGGSSDGAAALLLLNDFWRLSLDRGTLLRLAEQLGSDCPLFIDGGVQSVGGRGEVVEQLPPPSTAWLCILTPPVVLQRKTALLYSLVDTGHYEDGQQTAALAHRLREQPQAPLRAEDLSNAFDLVADQAFGPLDLFRSALRDVGASAVHMCGAGPSLYGLFASESEAVSAEQDLRRAGNAAWAVYAPAL